MNESTSTCVDLNATADGGASSADGCETDADEAGVVYGLCKCRL